jgi:hypothetical protein|tara:strand:- start:623 stop:1549 length:927 start_codon:yes stop_codon:yes gene_type:complete
MNTEQSQINSIAKVRIKATYLPTKAKHEASINTLARIYGADPKAIDAGLHFLPAEDNAIADARNIVTAGKKAIILSAHDDNGRRIKSSLKPMGSDNIGWYYADADDADAIREIADDTSRKLDDCKSRIERDWDALVAEGKALLGKAADQFVYPERDEYISRASFIVKIRNGSINFKDSAFDALGDELAASLRAEQQVEQEQLIESHRAGVDAFFSNVADQVSKIEASLKKGKRLRPEGFDTLLNEARDLQQDNWLGDSNIDAISNAFEAVLRSVESFPALSRSERKAKAKEIRQTTVDSIQIAKSIGL